MQQPQSRGQHRNQPKKKDPPYIDRLLRKLCMKGWNLIYSGYWVFLICFKSATDYMFSENHTVFASICMFITYLHICLLYDNKFG